MSVQLINLRLGTDSIVKTPVRGNLEQLNVELLSDGDLFFE
jgi:hypothetical protein